MVVGPSMSWESYFVKLLLQQDHIEFENQQKQRRIHLLSGLYQDMFKEI